MNKGNGIFDHMCCSKKTVCSNVPRNLIPEKYALYFPWWYAFKCLVEKVQEHDKTTFYD